MVPDSGGDARDLAEFVRTNSGGAFERLARRYAGFVYATCLRRLGRREDAEDAGQAVFAVLARKASSVRPGDLASWLHGTALRAASVAVRARRRRERHEEEAARMRPEETRPPEGASPEVRALLDDELARLPAKLREAVSRHYLAGQSHGELARDLGVPEGTVASRVSAGLDRLRQRLERRGIALSAAALLGSLAAESAVPVPPTLLAALPQLAAGGSAATAAAGGGAGVASIAKGVVKMMFWGKVKTVAAAVLCAAAVGAAGGPPVYRAAFGGEEPAVSAQERIIKARVVAVDGEKATISAGSEQGVKERFEFVCEEKGWTGTVESVTGTRAVLLSPGGKAAVGDEVKTKLSVVLTTRPPEPGTTPAPKIAETPFTPAAGFEQQAKLELVLTKKWDFACGYWLVDPKSGEVLAETGGNAGFAPRDIRFLTNKKEQCQATLRNCGGVAAALPFDLNCVPITFHLLDGAGRIVFSATPKLRPTSGPATITVLPAGASLVARPPLLMAFFAEGPFEDKYPSLNAWTKKKLGNLTYGIGPDGKFSNDVKVTVEEFYKSQGSVKVPRGTYKVRAEVDLGAGGALPGGAALAGGKLVSNEIDLLIGMEITDEGEFKKGQPIIARKTLELEQGGRR